MNTKRLAILLMGLILLSCSKPGSGPIENPEDPGVDSKYSVLLSNDGAINSAGFTANAVEISTDGVQSQVAQTGTEMLYYRKGNTFSFLNPVPGCNASIQYWDEGGISLYLDQVFPEDDNCERKIIAFSHSEQAFYIAYSIPGTGMKEVLYYIRALQFEDGDAVFDDIAIQKEPLQLLSSGNRVFVLTFDTQLGNNTLQVLNAATGTEEMTSDLGTGVVKVISTTEGNILVSYPTRHLILEAYSLEVLSRVSYLDGKEPNFANSESYYFDPAGALYYAMPTDPSDSFAAHIPAVYDFSKYTAYLYFFENFLSEDRLEAYDIGDTRAVAYDHNNGILLIGYEKANAAGTGGLVRIKPDPEPEFIDQTDLEGEPLCSWED
jgi:hypothetical protein